MQIAVRISPTATSHQPPLGCVCKPVLQGGILPSLSQLRVDIVCQLALSRPCRDHAIHITSHHITSSSVHLALTSLSSWVARAYHLAISDLIRTMPLTSCLHSTVPSPLWPRLGCSGLRPPCRCWWRWQWRPTASSAAATTSSSRWPACKQQDCCSASGRCHRRPWPQRRQQQHRLSAPCALTTGEVTELASCPALCWCSCGRARSRYSQRQQLLQPRHGDHLLGAAAGALPASERPFSHVHETARGFPVH